MRFRCSCFVLVLTSISPLWADAQPRNESVENADERARELFLKGDRAYAEGDYEGALTSFEAAFALSKRHALLYNMANAHERLGEYGKALEKLRQYLPHAPSSQQKLIEKRIATLQLRYDEQQESGESGSTSAQPKDVPSNEEELDTQAVSLDATSSPPYLGYALVGVGALGLGVGTYFGFQALSARSEAKDACPEVNGARRCLVDTKDAVDKDKRSSLLADVGLGVGIASAAVGVWLILTHDGKVEREAEDSAWVASPHAGGGKIDWVVRF